MVRLFRGTCLAVRAMHEYRPTTPGSAMPANRNGTTDPSASSTTKSKLQQEEDYEDNDERFPQAEGDAEGGYSYDGSGLGSSVPLVTKFRVEDDGSENDIAFDGDEEQPQQQANSTLAVVPYAHRDLKPG